MISPQKFSKSLGNNKLKIGISLKGFMVSSAIPMILNLYGFETHIALGGMLLAIGVMSLRNKFLEPSFFKNSIMKKTHIRRNRIDVNRDK